MVWEEDVVSMGSLLGKEGELDVVSHCWGCGSRMARTYTWRRSCCTGSSRLVSPHWQ